MKYKYSTYSNLIYIYVFYSLGIAIYLVLVFFIFNLSTTIISLPIIISYLYYPLSKIYELSIDDKVTKYKDFFGRKLVLENSNIYYTEHYFISKNHKFLADRDTIVIKIILPNKIISIYKDKYQDFQRLRKVCKEHFIYTSNTPIYHNKYRFYIIMFCIFIINIILTNFIHHKQKQKIEESIERNGYIKLNTKYQSHKIKHTKGGQISYIHIQLFDYAKYKFSINTAHYINNKAIYNDSIFIKNKSLKIYISPYEYKKKIEKTQDFNFYDTFIGEKNIISVYKIEY